MGPGTLRIHQPSRSRDSTHTTSPNPTMVRQVDPECPDPLPHDLSARGRSIMISPYSGRTSIISQTASRRCGGALVGRWIDAGPAWPDHPGDNLPELLGREGLGQELHAALAEEGRVFRGAGQRGHEDQAPERLRA